MDALKQRVLNPGINRNSLDIERANFEKDQLTSIQKAINNDETPVKEKHVRKILLGTHRLKSSNLFWNVVMNHTDFLGNQIVAWKLCHVLHKLLREGHESIFRESRRYEERIKEVGRMWVYLKEGYGKLIAAYSKFILIKIAFHLRNNKFPGNLQVSNDELDAICGQDVTLAFELCCELFDYMDEILSLQAVVFASLDTSRSVSMTNAGQCRLAPLIPCIQDSSALYDYTVKVLFKLHSCLPGDALEGHRMRFDGQFNQLKKFYYNSSNLQYFKNLVQVPLLPETSPNFRIASDIGLHVTPIVVVPHRADSPDGTESIAPSASVVHDSGFPLVDLSTPIDGFDDSASQWPSSVSQINGGHGGAAGGPIGGPSILQQKNQIIEQLQDRINYLEHSIQQVAAEKQLKAAEYESNLGQLRCIVAEMERGVSSMEQERDIALKEVQEAREEISRLKQGTDASTELAKEQEKVERIRAAYQKFRGEHLDLIKKESQARREIATLEGQLAQLRSSQSTLESQLEQLRLKDSKASEDVLVQVSDLKRKLTSAEEEAVRWKAAHDKVQHDLQSQVGQADSRMKELQEYLRQVEIESAEKSRNSEWRLLVLIMQEVSKMISDVQSDEALAALMGGQNPIHASPQNFFSSLESLRAGLISLGMCAPSVASNATATPLTESLVSSLLRYGHSLAFACTAGKFIYSTLPNLELADRMLDKIKALAAYSQRFVTECSKKNYSAECYETMTATLDGLIDMRREIIPQFSANADSSKDMATQLMEELSEMDAAIQAATLRFEEIMAKTRREQEGIKLEVHETILGACTTLMKDVTELIIRSRTLQREIVSQGRGSHTEKEFYQRNSRWSEGLLSAAKYVASVAKSLVEVADEVVAGRANVEKLAACAQGIVSATAQLTYASKVKANPASQNLLELERASKRVSQSTGNVVAAAKSGMKSIQNAEDDLLGGQNGIENLRGAKAHAYEMELRTKVIRLEVELTQARESLNKFHQMQHADQIESTD